MFEISAEEWEFLRYQFGTSKMLGNEDVTKDRRGGVRYLPYAFTEQGVAMLSGILNSEKAVAMNIAIMRAFVELRKVLALPNQVRDQLLEIKERLNEHDAQLSSIYDAIENLLDEKALRKSWEDRERIGFRKE